MLQKEALLFIFVLLLVAISMMMLSQRDVEGKKKRYIVVGGGPVGLWTAALLSLKGEQVDIFEKRGEYIRTQPIRLWPSFFAKLYAYPILYTPKGRSLCQVLQSFGMKPFKIRRLESLLKEWLLREVPDLVKFHQVDIRCWEDLESFKLKPHENVSWLYACDGAHSAWRERYFQTEKGQHFQTILDMEHAKVDLSTFRNKLRKVLLEHFSYAIETVVRLSSQRTHLVLKAHLNPEQIEALQMDVKIVKIRRIVYSCYWADEAVNEKENVILCGDSLCGVPFTRSLRNGLSCALVATQWPAWVYHNYYIRLKIQEKLVSNLLNQSLRFARGSLK